MKNFTIPKISVESIKFTIQSMDRKILIRTGIISGIYLAFLIVFLLPIYIYNHNTGSEVKRLKDKVAQANIKIVKIPVMIKQRDQFGVRIKKIREEFFEPQETDKLIEIISNFAGETGAKI